ncbi:MAG: glycoside hydrolase family 1 protein [Actinomycetes bacterium]
MSVSEQPAVAAPATGEPPAYPFPPGFVWGAATAAYQVEGAVTEDGRGPSIWDTFSRLPGRVRNGDTGDVAVDHYHRYPEDVRLMAELGLSAYRFSVAWPRIQPLGQGPANQVGLDHYRRLVDALLEAGIKPVLTLYHWDLPQALQDAGGWPNRDTALRFADYAEIVYAALGDRVQSWTTINEPSCAGLLGYSSGRHAPGVQDPPAALRAVHHLLLGHGLAVAAMRAAGVGGPERTGGDQNRFGISLDPAPITPATTSVPDLDAARRIDALRNRIYLDPLLLGRYPADMLADTAALTDWSFVTDGDPTTISAPIDMLGINYYQPFRVRKRPGPIITGGVSKRSPSSTDLSGRSDGNDREESRDSNWPDQLPSEYPGCDDIEIMSPPGPVTGGGWGIDPLGLVELLTRIHRDYPAIPLMVTENGAAFDDRRGPDGRIADPDRIDYLAGHLRASHEAIALGVDLRGYFVWSLMDNFEWAEGYARRFGIVHVDFRTGRRSLKDSALWYRNVIARNGLD